MNDFAGKTILVTGASGGIGGATVRKLVARGAKVIASARTRASLEDIVGDTGAVALPFDLTSEDSIAGALADLDLWSVVNCGGWGGEIATPQDTDIAVFDKVMSINARGALLVTKYAARTMIRIGQGGSIVNVSSQASLVAITGHICYGSSKAARGQHHPGVRAGARRLRHPGQQRQPDSGDDADVRLVLGAPGDRPAISGADAVTQVGHRR